MKYIYPLALAFHMHISVCGAVFRSKPYPLKLIEIK